MIKKPRRAGFDLLSTAISQPSILLSRADQRVVTSLSVAPRKSGPSAQIVRGCAINKISSGQQDDHLSTTGWLAAIVLEKLVTFNVPRAAGFLGSILVRGPSAIAVIKVGTPRRLPLSGEMLNQNSNICRSGHRMSNHFSVYSMHYLGVRSR